MLSLWVAEPTGNRTVTILAVAGSPAKIVAATVTPATVAVVATEAVAVVVEIFVFRSGGDVRLLAHWPSP
jgi:hypothetical protein